MKDGITGPQQIQWEKSQTKYCYWCGTNCESDYHVDHYFPLSKGGEHEESNLVIACPMCNLSKSTKDPEVFEEEILGMIPCG